MNKLYFFILRVFLCFQKYTISLLSNQTKKDLYRSLSPISLHFRLNQIILYFSPFSLFPFHLFSHFPTLLLNQKINDRFLILNWPDSYKKDWKMLWNIEVYAHLTSFASEHSTGHHFVAPSQHLPEVPRLRYHYRYTESLKSLNAKYAIMFFSLLCNENENETSK